MNFRWHHEVSADWMKARKKYLMASDIVALLPAYKRAKKAKWTPGTIVPEFAALYAEKQSDMALKTETWDAAARGHFMEPYAVRELCEIIQTNLDHWDDILIHTKDGTLGFSPDALDWRQEYFIDEMCADDLDGKVEFVAEIKCYEPKKHMKSVLANKFDLPEMYQLAVAFCVMPYVQIGGLFFYCPSAPIPMKYTRVERKDLADHFATIDGIREIWRDTVLRFGAVQNKYKPMYTEQQLMKYYMDQLDDSMFVLK